MKKIFIRIMAKNPSAILIKKRLKNSGKFRSVFQLFHINLFWCVISNLISNIVFEYHKWYYWPIKIAGKFDVPYKYYLIAKAFHLFRYLLFIGILVVSFIYYVTNNDWYFYYILIPVFVLLFIDIILNQGADIMTFMHLRSEAVLSIILLDDDFRLPFLKKYNTLHENEAQVTPISLWDDKKNSDFLNQMIDTLHGTFTGIIRKRMFSLIPLSLRHIISIIYVYSLLMLCLEINWQNRNQGYAYENLGHTAPIERSFSTFFTDLSGCLYFQAVTCTTTGFGDISPNKISPAIRTIQFVLLLSILFTIFVTINISLKATDQIIERLKNRDLLKNDITTFMCNDNPYLIIY